MSMSGGGISAGRVSAISVALLMLLTSVNAVMGSAVHDDASYRAGYVAASNSALVRAAMARPEMAPATLCDTIVQRALVGDDSTWIVRSDFIRGCTRAIAEAME
ncbi:hypothetical protein [Mycolicibacterium sp. YH-1]|uniref:hypothetical protein n=1 Tax=Mycolicibacterium sp. YH-1 TaxID=2908837 RepID=UPI001F4C1373|nr:hypothetical protein [Mycolicibacterium sp. YH-1]UNB49836.1 hypothetical protein L0M16_17605 [Mycolicibacterium sp. YH-1]